MRYFEIDIDEDQFRRFIKAVIDQYERAELVETTETMH